MQIMITRPTVAKPRGEEPRAVEPNEILDIDDVQAAQLIALRKAVRWQQPANAPETATAPAPRRRKAQP